MNATATRDAELPPRMLRAVRATKIVSYLGAPFIAVYGVVSLVNGHPLISLQQAIVVALFLAAPQLIRVKRYHEAVLMLIAAAHVQVFAGTVLFGYEGCAAHFYSVLIIGPYLMLPRDSRPTAHALALAAGVLWLGLTLFQSKLPPPTVEMPLLINQALNILLLLLGLMVLTWGFIAAVDDAEDSLQKARARADDLLLNVLPASIAERLKEAPNQPIADDYPEVTVLFADLVGFTALSSRQTAGETLAMISEIFSEFDAICERTGAERIKTIGDGYMAVCGAPTPRADHALVMAEVAKELVAYMKARDDAEKLRIRVGLNSGEVVGGVVGRTRFAFDLWGDVVNVASRMESTAEVGEVQLSTSTHALIADAVPCSPRGRVHLKGKGEVEAWYLA